ncbi:hypothetical protein M0638_12800 [Roseomonas sp. NAR14]|uniref:DUF2272 domain-containing protein n=1 Tax=Roseomonas acroporae TaxID=2937791 RepID=A0A9X2BWT0_9PROT|nr:hypothetical protein [Roseomonas acroporae]MCK8785264.1 hypothetical protein [Roseomonas acroporae]
MAHLRIAPGTPAYGASFGPPGPGGTDLLVVPRGGSASLLLVAGAELTPKMGDEGIAGLSEGKVSAQERNSAELTGWERSQDLRKLVVTGRTLGRTTLNAYLNGSTPWVREMAIEVVGDPEARRAGEKAFMTDSIKREVAALSFRKALVRVAEDQMNSKIGRTANGGDGRYGLKAGMQWCGAFVHWCYQAVGSVKGGNPLGGNVNTLASPEKAIGWTLHNPTLAEVLRYAGPDPYGWSWDAVPKADAKALVQKDYVDIDGAHPVRMGDVCLIRSNDPPKPKPGEQPKPKSAGMMYWKHVCMVVDPPGEDGKFTTIDGNQTGAYRPDGSTATECIGKNTKDASERLMDGKSHKCVFVHMKTIGDP